MRRSGDVVRVSAELINTEDGSAQWSERYDRPYKDLFALQDEITHAVAGALKAKLLPAEHAAAQSDRPPSGSLEAYNAYLQGQSTPPATRKSIYRKAIEFFTRADATRSALYPRLVRALDNLGQRWRGFLDGAPAQEAYAKAREAAGARSTSRRVSPMRTSAQGYLFLRADFNWRGAEAEYRRAIGARAERCQCEIRFRQPTDYFR